MNREEVIDRILDSKDTTVGGGSASALAAAMAAGMAGMVARLSAGKDLGLDDSCYAGFAEKLDKLAEELTLGASLDAEAFSKISSAFRLPKSNDEEKAKRSAAVEQAAIAAATAPLDNSKRALEAIEVIGKLTGKHNTNADSDLMIGKHFLNIALYGFALNIEANLSLIKTEETKKTFREAAEALRARSGL